MCSSGPARSGRPPRREEAGAELRGEAMESRSTAQGRAMPSTKRPQAVRMTPERSPCSSRKEWSGCRSNGRSSLRPMPSTPR
eukprot:6349928-Heterocapsa_arctica.AAC.1